METGDHQKNGASSKSQMSRKNHGMVSLFLALFVLMIGGVMSTSCGGGDDEDDWTDEGNSGDGKQELRVSYSSIEFTSIADSYEVTVKCNGSWTAACNASWCTVSPNQGNGDKSVTVNVSKNQTEDDRETVITFRSENGEKKSLKISQSAGKLEACAPSSLSGTITLTTLTVYFSFPYAMEKVKVEAYKPSTGRWVKLSDKVSGSGTSYAISPYRDYLTEPVQYGLAKVRVSGYKGGKWGPTKTVVFDIGWNKVYEE